MSESVSSDHASDLAAACARPTPFPSPNARWSGAARLLGLASDPDPRPSIDRSGNWARLLGEEGQRVLASGPILSLMDMASGMAIWRAMDEFTAIATLDLRVDYVRPAREQASVFGRAQCYRLTRSAAFVRGLAHDGDADDPVAHIQAVFMKITSTARL